VLALFARFSCDAVIAIYADLLMLRQPCVITLIITPLYAAAMRLLLIIEPMLTMPAATPFRAFTAAAPFFDADDAAAILTLHIAFYILLFSRHSASLLIFCFDSTLLLTLYAAALIWQR